MKTLYLNKSSLSVKLASSHLLLHDQADDQAPLVKVPLADVERVVIVGQPAISFPVLARFMDLQIPCSFLTAGGRWRGLMDGDSGFHAGRRMRQYETMADERFTLRFAKRIAQAKIANARRTLQRLAANRGASLKDQPGWNGLDVTLAALDLQKDVEAVRGLEGLAATRYFRLLADFFPDDAPFPSRSRRPPRDPANALLSFCYALLLNEVVPAVRAHGLDVAAGYFHCGRDRSPALALDLMEPFRSPVADRLVLDLLNHRRVRVDEHFERQKEGGVFLSEAGRAIVFKAFDEAMQRRSETGQGSLTLRQQIDRGVCQFIALLEQGEEPTFFRAA